MPKRNGNSTAAEPNALFASGAEPTCSQGEGVNLAIAMAGLESATRCRH
ncbi:MULTISPECIES: hypothetical protein [Xanthomonas]|nr:MULTISPECIES: hypothetical protein [Xanthomonas]